MADEIYKSTTYVVMEGSGVSKSTGYVVASHYGAVSSAKTYAVLSNPTSLTKSTAYAVLEPRYPPYEDLRIDTSFVDVRFPECVSFGSSGGPGFKTSVYEMDSGLTSTVVDWSRLRARYEVVFDHVDTADMVEVEDFFYGTRGSAVAFRYKDWSDYLIANQVVAIGDGTTRAFQLFKRYSSGGAVYDRIIKKPVNGTYSITVDGVTAAVGTDVFVSLSDGTLTFVSAPADGAIIVIVQGEFDVPVRFDTDFLSIGYSDWRQFSISNLPLIEVLV